MNWTYFKHFLKGIQYIVTRFSPLPRVEHLRTFLWVDWKFNHNRKLMRVILGKCFQLINQSLFLPWKRVKKQKFFLFLFDFTKRISHWILSVEASRCWDFFQNPRRQKYWPFQLRLFSCACFTKYISKCFFYSKTWWMVPASFLKKNWKHKRTETSWSSSSSIYNTSLFIQ